VRSLLKERGEEILKLFDNKELMDFVAKYNQEYVHWDQLRYKKIPQDVSPELVWALLSLFRREQYRALRFEDLRLKYILLNETLRKLHLLDKGCAGYLESGLEFVNLQGKERYIISSLMEEAIASSQIEGAATTRKVAKELLRLNKKPRNYSEQMIVNGYRTMQKIVKMKDGKITPDLILKLHQDITMDTLKNKKDEGRFRDNNDILIADSVSSAIYHHPPDFRKIPELIQEFCNFANDDSGDFIHPIIKGIILHFLIGYIHPFNDGNGRTARTLFYWYALSRGYWLFQLMSVSRILLRSKKNYGLSYLHTETDENDMTYFINYNLSAIEEALHEMEAYIGRKQKEQQETMKLLRGLKNVNVRQADILKELMKDPERSILISEIMTTYNVVYDTARNDLLHLTRMGYLQKLKVKRTFVFRLAERKGL